MKKLAPANLIPPVARAIDYSKQRVVSYGLPVYLKIPKINVNASIDSLGVTSRGALDVPSLPTNAGWYKLGPRPGEIGSAVIDGHFGWKDNIPAVFDDLHKLEVGDSLSVQDVKGVTTTFIVTSIQTFDKNDDDSVVFRSSDGRAHLNLITCEGLWSPTGHSYSNRLVVFADKQT